MTENNWQASRRRDNEREELIDNLTRGTREINKNMNEMEGWADRIMRAVLTPAGKDATLWYNNLSTKKGGAPYKREQ
jgi:hypothetical protein